LRSSTQAIVLAIVSLTVHLVEEVASGIRQRYLLASVPRWLLATISVLLYGFCLATLVLTAQGLSVGAFLAWVLAAVLILNGLGHLGIMMVRRRYFPGGITAVVLLIAATVLMDALLL